GVTADTSKWPEVNRFARAPGERVYSCAYPLFSLRYHNVWLCGTRPKRLKFQLIQAASCRWSRVTNWCRDRSTVAIQRSLLSLARNSTAATVPSSLQRMGCMMKPVTDTPRV